jgi:hypothetical protein
MVPKNSLMSLAEPRSASFDRVGPSAAMMCVFASARSRLDHALHLSTNRQQVISIKGQARDNNRLNSPFRVGEK